MTIDGCRVVAGHSPRLMRWAVIPILLIASWASASPRHVVFDAARLRTGTFTYRAIMDGKPADLSTSSITRLPDGTYRFVAAIPAFDQSWSTVATRSLAPVATRLEMPTRDGRRYTLTLSYSHLKVSGNAVVHATSGGGLLDSDVAVTERITPSTVDQRIDWAAVMSTDKKPGEAFDFEVYDAKTALSPVHCRVTDAGMMDTPAGRVRALRMEYTVHKSTGTETYTVYTTAAFPRVMLREELRGNLVIRLVGIRR